MGQTCSVCRHKHRDMIDRDLVAGVAKMVLAKTYRIGRNSLKYHEQHHLPATLLKGREHQRLEIAEELRGKIAKVIGTLEEVGELAIAEMKASLPSGRRRAISKRVSAGRRYVETSRELTRALEVGMRAHGIIQGGVQINVLVERELGIPIAQARAAIEAVKQAESGDVHELANRAAEQLRWYAGKFPSQYAALKLPLPQLQLEGVKA